MARVEDLGMGLVFHDTIIPFRNAIIEAKESLLVTRTVDPAFLAEVSPFYHGPLPPRNGKHAGLASRSA